uniref:Insulin n=1 Tax=Conus tessulatus TaxID=101317 RepID=A0A1B3IIZ6_CONTS|nr:insulin precursor [Conus tessulatus]
MMTSSYFLLVALGLLLYVCQSSFGREHLCEPEDPPHPQGKCGAELYNHYVESCEEEEAEQTRTYYAWKKRGRASPLRKRRGFLSMLKTRFMAPSRGIVCECCQNHCTEEEITEYCPPLTESSG